MAKKEQTTLSGFPEFISFKFAMEKFSISRALLRKRIIDFQITEKKRKARLFIHEPSLKKSFVAPPTKGQELKEKLLEQKLISEKLKNKDTIHEIIEKEYANFYKEASFVFDGLRDMPEKLGLNNDQQLMWNTFLGQATGRLENLSEEH